MPDLKTGVLYYGDNLEILRDYIPGESVDLIYLDPPFNSQQQYNVLFKEPTGQGSAAQIRAFTDTWHWDRERVSCLWPFRTRKKFAETVVEVMARIALTVSGQVTEEWKAGHLGRGEYVAMLFPTVGALELAKCLLTVDMALLNDLRKDDLPEATAPIGGYLILLVTLFHALREVMRNSPEVATAIGTSHHDLVQKYADLSGFEERMFTEGIASIDKVIAESDGDPRPAWEQRIIDFVETMSVRGPGPGFTLEKMMFSAFFMRVMSDLAHNHRMVLGNSAITAQADLVRALMGAPHG